MPTQAKRGLANAAATAATLCSILDAACAHKIIGRADKLGVLLSAALDARVALRHGDGARGCSFGSRG